jgi:hypothetical protein
VNATYKTNIDIGLDGNGNTVKADVSGGGSVQIAANNDGVHVGWHPYRNPNLDGSPGNPRVYQSFYQYKTNTTGLSADWGSGTPVNTVDHLSNNMSPRFLASADKHYYYSLPNNGASPGPYWQQADDGSDADVQSLNGNPGVKTNGYYFDFYLSPAWNGSEMNLASIETTSGLGDVSLYLDVEGTTSQVTVYGGGDAGSVALAAVGGTNYVFFTAPDLGIGTDDEIFVRPVGQDGTLGDILQLTDDNYHQLELDVAGWGGAANPNLHLTYTTYAGTIWDDSAERVGYMHLTPEPASLGLLLLGAGLLRRRMKK